MKYKVLRAFLLSGVRQEVGSEVDLTSRDLIGGLKTNGKIEAVEASEEPKPGPMTTETVGGLIGGVKQAKAKD
jgi:hypothetical protein